MNAISKRTTPLEIVLLLIYLAMTYFPRGLRPKYHRPWRS